MERKIHNPWTWQDQFGFVQANEVSGAERVVFCSGQTPTDENGTPQHAGDMAAQIALTLDNVETVLGEAGMDLSNVIRMNYFTTDIDAFMAAGAVLGERLAAGGCRPVSTLLGVTRLAFPELLVEIEVTAIA